MTSNAIPVAATIYDAVRAAVELHERTHTRGLICRADASVFANVYRVEIDSQGLKHPVVYWVVKL